MTAARTTFGLIALVLVAATLAAGCGGGDSDTDEGTPPATQATTETGDDGATAQGDATAGESVFASAGCGNCHTLAAAGSSGGVGPNLDEAGPTFDQVVAKVTSGGGGMPSFSDQLSEDEIRNVAAFVSESAGG